MLGDAATRNVVVLLAVMFIVIVTLCLLSRLDLRSPSLLRLDWFLPVLRKRPDRRPLNSRWVGRVLRAAAPRSWLSDRTTKQRGSLRRWLRRLGPGWLASPVRRSVQAICLVLFLLSFFYVCWPYTARPADEPRSSTGWQFRELRQDTGAVVLVRDASSSMEEWIVEGADLFVAQEGSSSVAVRALDAGDDQLTLMPLAPLPDLFLDGLLMGSGSYSVLDASPDAWPSHYADDLASKEIVQAELFLMIDPLVSLSTAIAARSWVASLVCALMILIVCVLIPRGFCGYLCPLGTTIDLFDWAIGSRTTRLRVSDDGWWVHIKYYLLATTLVASVGGVLVSGFVSAIPVITRALLFAGEPLQSGAMRGWHLVPAWNWGHVVSITLFLAVLGLGFLQPRFWCKYVCPSGALFSLGNLIRVTERKVESSCIHCNKCVEICPFDAIKPDFTTRTTDCTLCQSCGGVCPTHAIKFVERWNVVELKVQDDPPTGETPIGRRGFISLAAGTAAATVGGVGMVGATKLFGARVADAGSPRPLRPPGSVPEQQFLQLCIRCGECFKACPNNVLQPQAFEQGLEGVWTPKVVADWAGCESSCNACGQVCPTGAIRPLPLEEKKVARMGLAYVNEATCLPMAGREDCDLCVQECRAAGYDAIEYMQVGTEVDEAGVPIDGTGMLAPVVVDDKCVGCGLCQTRCYGINVKDRGVLPESAIIIRAGTGHEDRISSGSYVELRRQESSRRAGARTPSSDVESRDKPEPPAVPESNQGESVDLANPFGL